MIFSRRRTFALLLLLGAGCEASAPPAPGPGPSAAEADLNRVQSRLADAGTIRVHIEGRWSEVGPFGTQRPQRGNPQSFSADLLLGEAGRVRMSLVVTDKAGFSTTQVAIADGKRVWVKEPEGPLKVSLDPSALRRELLSAISSGGIGSWFATHVRGNETLPRGDSFPGRDGLPPDAPRPGDALLDPPRLESGVEGTRVLNHYSPDVQRRIRTWFDSATGDLRKREVLDQKIVWCAEVYSDLQLGMTIPESEFHLPD